MQRVFAVFLFLSFIFLFEGCGRYPPITWRQQVIPGHCFAWTNGCNIFCRKSSNNYKDWFERAFKENCKDIDEHGAQCIDDDQEKLNYCYEESE